MRISNVYSCRKPPFTSYHRIISIGKIFNKTRFTFNHGEYPSSVTLGIKHFFPRKLANRTQLNYEVVCGGSVAEWLERRI